MLEIPECIIKLTDKAYKKATNTPFYNKVRVLLDNMVNVDNANDITYMLNSLYETDYQSMFDKTFTLTYKNLKKDRNISYFDWNLETDKQRIVIANNWKKSASTQFKKCTILDAYFHELTHKKQCDYACINESMDLKKNAFDKLLCLEFYSKTYLPYELQLCEIEARMEATHRYIDLIKKRILPANQETLYNPLGNIDDILFAFNRFKTNIGEVKFDIDKFVMRYIASMKLTLIRCEEDKKEYAFLFNEAFITKFRIILQKKLEKFQKDIEYVYAKLLKCYKISPKVRKKLGMDAEAENFFYADAKKYKSNDYYLNIMNIDLKDRFYVTNRNMHFEERNYVNFKSSEFEEDGDINEKNN